MSPRMGLGQGAESQLGSQADPDGSSKFNALDTALFLY